MPTEDQYWEALQARICSKCVDGDGAGGCRVSGGDCALKQHLPNIIGAVSAVYSTSVDLYLEQLRSKVCRECTHQSADGACSLRDNVDCALDRYFPLIVEVIEEIRNDQ